MPGARHRDPARLPALNPAPAGGELDLTCTCDIRIASEQAKIAESFVKLGIASGDGGARLLPRIIGLSRAAEPTFTGQMIDARQALEWNLVSRVAPAEELLPTAYGIAQAIAGNPPQAVRLAKRRLREGMLTRLDTLLEMSAAFKMPSDQTEDHREAVSAFVEKCSPSLKG